MVVIMRKLTKKQQTLMVCFAFITLFTFPMLVSAQTTPDDVLPTDGPVDLLDPSLIDQPDIDEPLSKVWDTYQILGTDLRVSTAIKSSHVTDEIGNRQLTNFEPLAYEQIDETTFLLKSYATFTWEYQVFTDDLIREITFYNRPVEATYVKLALCTDFNLVQSSQQSEYLIPEFWIGTPARDREVTFEYGTVELSNQIISYPDYGNFERPYSEFNINLDLHDIDFTGLTGGFEVTADNIQTQMDNCRVVGMRETNIGFYESDFNENIPTVRFSPDTGDYSGTLNDIDAYGLGVYQASTSPNPNPVTVMQGTSRPASIGSDLRDFRRLEYWLAPNVLEYKQNYEVRYAELLIDTEEGFTSPAELVQTRDQQTNLYQRTLGSSIENKAQTYIIETGFQIWSTAKITATNAVGSVPLEDVTLNLDDFYWDNYVTGTTDIQPPTPTVTSWEQFWDDNGTAIIIILIAVGGIAVATIVYKVTKDDSPEVKVYFESQMD